MASYRKTLKAVFWKNYLLSKTQWIWIALEIVVPIVFFALLSYGRVKSSNSDPKSVNTSLVYSMNDVKSFLKADDANWELWFAPSEEHHARIIEYVCKELGIDDQNPLNFGTNDELSDALKRYTGDKDIYAVFFEKDAVHHQFSYNISVRKRYLEWKTDEFYRKDDGFSDNKDYNPYLHEGFLALQILLDKALIAMFFQYDNSPNITVTLQEIRDDLNTDLNRFLITILPLAVMFTLCLPIFLSVQEQMVRDQDSGINDLMKISGVQMSVILLGWFLQRTLAILVALIPITVLLTLNFWGSAINYCNWVILFLFLFFYSLTSITAYLFIACTAKNSSVRYVIGMIFWLLSYFLPTVLMEHTTVQTSSFYRLFKMILALFFPNIGLHFGCEILAAYENAQIELNFGNLFTSEHDDLQMGYILLILLLNIILTFISSLNLVFDLRKVNKKQARPSDTENIPLKDTKAKPSFVTIRNLKKKYDVYTALDIPKLELREGEVTAVLGTNGSGKTTLISIITGITKSYSGSVIVHRTQLGFCPQTNILFEDLTVEENLSFFAQLRTDDVAGSVVKILEELELTAKHHETVRYLSTGLRRKLCLGMALVGDPEIIILDEPTGAVINETRFSIREVLKKRSNNTILITTGNSQEAEFLADNILLINNGKILNQENISFSGLRRNDGHDYISVMITDVSHIGKTEEMLKVNLPDVKILTRIGKKLILYAVSNREKFLECIKVLESNKAEWYIETISYNTYTLGNIFIKALQGKGKTQQNTSASLANMEDRKLPLLSSLFEHRDLGFTASILMKKWFFFSKKFYWYLPGLLTLLLFTSLIVMRTSQGRHQYTYNEPSLEFNLDVYAKSEIFYSGIARSKIDPIMGDTSKVQEVSIWEKLRTKTIQLKDTNIVGVDFNIDENNGRNIGVNIIYSARAFHSAPIAVDFAMNTVLKLAKSDSSYAINTLNVPAKKRHTDYVMKDLSEDRVFLLWTILLPLGIFFLLADSVIFPNIEFTTQFLRLQATTIHRIFWYWNLHLLFDVCQAAFQILLILLYIFLLNNLVCSDPLLDNHEFQILFLILLIYVACQMPSCYLFGSLTKSDQGYKKLILFGILSGVLPILIYSSGVDNGIAIFVMYALSSLFPQFGICYTLYKFGLKFTENYNWNHMNPLVKKMLCEENTTNPCCSQDSAECYEHQSYLPSTNSFLLPILASILWQGLLVFVSSRRFEAWKIQRNDSRSSQTQTTINEEVNPEPNSMVIEDLTFPELQTNLVYTFQPNALHGVLGSNASGKSLLLATLSKENLSFDGVIYRVDSSGHKILIKDEQYIKDIGYFPGKDRLMYWLTGRELLTLAGLSRGYNINKSSLAANRLLDIFDLHLVANRKCVHYSGGKKKILQICNAFMGFCDFIVIDDVARSLDIPVTKTLWDFLLAFKQCTGKTVILGIAHTVRYNTLCDRCLLMDREENEQPSSQSFKITFRMKMDCSEDTLNRCKNEMRSAFDAEMCGDGSSRFISIKCSSNTSAVNNLSEVFVSAEKFKSDYPECIEDYFIAEI